MLLSDKIKKSKEEIKYSEQSNITWLLFDLIEKLNFKNDDFFHQSIPINIVSANESFFKETIQYCLFSILKK